MHPSAAAARTFGEASANLPRRVLVAVTFPTCPKATAAADGDVGVGLPEPRRQGVDRAGILANTDRIDRADQEPAFERFHGFAQRLVCFDARNRFQGNPRPRGKLFVGQQLAPIPAPLPSSRKPPVACRRSPFPRLARRNEVFRSALFPWLRFGRRRQGPRGPSRPRRRDMRCRVEIFGCYS